MKKVTTDKALLFSAILLLAYTVIGIVLMFMDKTIDSTLTLAVFGSFGVAEGGYCAFIHNAKKKKEESDPIE